MYSHNYNIPSNMRAGYQPKPYSSNQYPTASMPTISGSSMKGSYPVSNSSFPVSADADERFFWAPFVVGGLAGTALGYGIANNNQINNRPPVIYGPFPPPMYPAPYPPVYTTNYYY